MAKEKQKKDATTVVEQAEKREKKEKQEIIDYKQVFQEKEKLITGLKSAVPKDKVGHKSRARFFLDKTKIIRDLVAKQRKLLHDEAELLQKDIEGVQKHTNALDDVKDNTHTLLERYEAIAAEAKPNFASLTMCLSSQEALVDEIILCLKLETYLNVRREAKTIKDDIETVEEGMQDKTWHDFENFFQHIDAEATTFLNESGDKDTYDKLISLKKHGEAPQEWLNDLERMKKEMSQKITSLHKELESEISYVQKELNKRGMKQHSKQITELVMSGSYEREIVLREEATAELHSNLIQEGELLGKVINGITLKDIVLHKARATIQQETKAFEYSVAEEIKLLGWQHSLVEAANLLFLERDKKKQNVVRIAERIVSLIRKTDPTFQDSSAFRDKLRPALSDEKAFRQFVREIVQTRVAHLDNSLETNEKNMKKASESRHKKIMDEFRRIEEQAGIPAGTKLSDRIVQEAA